MRRRRRRRTGVRSKSKRTIIFRILFVVIAAAVITALAVLLGNYLGRKAAQAEKELDGTVAEIPVTEPAESDLLPDGVPADGKADGLKIVAADIAIEGVSIDDIGEKMWGLDDEYNAVSVRVTRDGKLIYLSPAVMELSGMESPATPDEKKDCASLPALRDIVSSAKGLGLRTSCIYGTVPSVLGDGEDAKIRLRTDSAVIGELCDAGFDEIVIDGLIGEEGTLDFATLSSVIEYLAALRGTSGEADLGVVLPARVYLDAPAAGQIATLEKYTDLLAIGVQTGDATSAEEAYDAVEESCYNLKGNFSAHNLRAIITSTNVKAAFGAYRALRDLSVANVQFCAYVPSPAADISEPQPEETHAAPAATEEKSNENALTGEKYKEMGFDTAETDETPQTEAPADETSAPSIWYGGNPEPPSGGD